MTVSLTEIPGYVAGTWTIDPIHSSVEFSVRHLMISKVRGRFSRFEGRLVTADDPLRSTVEATVDLASIDTANDQRDEHLRSADFFEVSQHPSMTYRSTGIEQTEDGYVLNGELTLKGVTKQVPLVLEVQGFGADYFLPDPQSGARAGFTASGELSRLAFGVGDSSPLAGGGVGLSDKVQITLEIQAVLTR